MSRFVLTLQPLPKTDEIRALRAALKTLRRRYRMCCVSLRELPDNQLRARTMPPAARDLRGGNRTEPKMANPRKETAMVTKNVAFPSKYIAAVDLPKPIVLDIVETNIETLKSRDGVSSKKIVVYFRGMSKALVVNSTNFNSIVEVTGEFNSDNWPGYAVELYATTTPLGGKTVPCVRVRAPGSAAKKAAPAKAVKPAPEIDEYAESENPEPADADF